jgi:dodecin
MFKMVEIIGSSSKGYSEAIREAVNQVCANGESAAWFEVLEQRGAIRDGQLKEFQVKLKVAVSVPEKKTKDSLKDDKNICPTCAEPVADNGHLCVPLNKKDQKCDWCGSLIVNERHLCNDKVKELAYICNSCGRTAVESQFLCSPKKIKSKS